MKNLEKKTSKTKEVKSPCVSVCVYDFEKGFCKGCYRDLDDIRNWWGMDNAEKRKALKRCKKNKHGERR